MNLRPSQPLPLRSSLSFIIQVLPFMFIEIFFFPKGSGLWIHNRFRIVRKICQNKYSQQFAEPLWSIIWAFVIFCPLSHFLGYLLKIHVSGIMDILFWQATILREYYIVKCENSWCNGLYVTYKLNVHK